MDSQRKTIQALTQTLDEKRGELARFYRDFGERLLSDSSDPAEGAGYVSADHAVQYRELGAARERDASIILDIQAAVERMQELARFRREIDRNVASASSRHDELLADLGKRFYGLYTDEDAAFFSDAYDRATEAGNALVRLEEKEAKLRAELAESGLLGKLVAQIRIAALSANVRLQRERVASAFREGGKAVIDAGVLDSRRADGSLDPSIVPLAADIDASLERVRAFRERAESVDADIARARESLAAAGSGDSTQRRIDELRARVRDSDRRIESLAALAAREYADKFLDESGRSILGGSGDGHSFSDMGRYAHELEQVSAMRAGIAENRLRIEVLEADLRIDAIDRDIAARRREAEDADSKAERLRQAAEAARKAAEAAAAERETLVARKEELMGILKGR